jgi:transcriptional regulator of acetoin/glycerol metabolism
VRELEQAIGAALALAGAGAIAVEHLPATVTAPRPVRSDDDGQREHLLALLTEHRGNVRAIARALGKDPVQIRRWLRRHGLEADAYR